MTIKEEYEKGIAELRYVNKVYRWDGEMHFITEFEHCSKKAQTMLRKLLEADVRKNEFYHDKGFREDDRYEQNAKVFREMKKSIDKMVII